MRTAQVNEITVLAYKAGNNSTVTIFAKGQGSDTCVKVRTQGEKLSNGA